MLRPALGKAIFACSARMGADGCMEYEK